MYSEEEVSVHDKAKDLWMTIHGGVYDLTDFLLKHPGGEEVLLKLAGQDGTVCFDEIGHTEEAIQLRETLKIGEVTGGGGGGGASKTRKNGPTVDDDDWVYEEPEKKSSPYLPVTIGLGVLVYAVVFYYLFF